MNKKFSVVFDVLCCISLWLFVPPMCIYKQVTRFSLKCNRQKVLRSTIHISVVLQLQRLDSTRISSLRVLVSKLLPQCFVFITTTMIFFSDCYGRISETGDSKKQTPCNVR